MSSIPKVNAHLIRSVAKAALKAKGLPKDDIRDMIDVVRLVLVAERKYYKRHEALALSSVLAPEPDAA